LGRSAGLPHKLQIEFAKMLKNPAEIEGWRHGRVDIALVWHAKVTKERIKRTGTEKSKEPGVISHDLIGMNRLGRYV